MLQSNTPSISQVQWYIVNHLITVPCIYCYCEGEVSRHLEQENHQAAVKIQTMWRGHQVRRSVRSRQEAFREIRAAIQIQRTVIY